MWTLSAASSCDLGRAELSRCYEVAAHLIESQVLEFSVLAPSLDLYFYW